MQSFASTAQTLHSYAVLQRKLAKLRTTAQTLQSYAYLIVTVARKLLAAVAQFVEFFVLVLTFPGGVGAGVVYGIIQLKEHKC